MKEEHSGVFDVRYLVYDEHDTLAPTILFLTPNRIVAVSRERRNSWPVVAVIVALVASFVGLFLRDFTLFLGGLGVGIVAGLCIVLIDFVLRQREFRKIRRLNPEHVLERMERGFEIRYEEITKIEVGISDRYLGIKDSILSSSFLQEHQYVITLATNEKKHTFILPGNKFRECLDLIRKFIPETTEIIETEEF